MSPTHVQYMMLGGRKTEMSAACVMSAIWTRGCIKTHRRCGRQRIVPARVPQLGIGIAAVLAARKRTRSTRIAVVGAAAAGCHAACRENAHVGRLPPCNFAAFLHKSQLRRQSAPRALAPQLCCQGPCLKHGAHRQNTMQDDSCLHAGRRLKHWLRHSYATCNMHRVQAAGPATLGASAFTWGRRARVLLVPGAGGQLGRGAAAGGAAAGGAAGLGGASRDVDQLPDLRLALRAADALLQHVQALSGHDVG
jgi:hypothetical protein